MPDAEYARQQIRARFARQFAAYEHLTALAAGLIERNRASLVADDERPSTQVVASLYAKTWKTTQAIYILASEGYGEDATILARSLTNLCIDLGYICRDEPDARARQWMAHGWWERLRMARELGIRTLDAERHEYNTSEGEALAREWKRVTIRERAERGGLRNFYEVAYRHASAFEHSDSWSVQFFVDVRDDHVDLHLGPSTSDVENALVTAAFGFYQVVVIAGEFFGFDSGSFNEEVQRVLTEAFNLDGRA